jgi:nucleotide-binding universal stress UspA family protein
VLSRIVVGYDDSEGARRALARAIELARHTKEGAAELIAVAVEEHLPHYAATVGEVTEEHELEQRACQRWLHAAQAYADEHQVPLRTEIRAGHAADQLVRAAKAHQADLLVLGHARHSTIRDSLIGGTAEKVTHNAPCSVLIAR